MFMPNISNVNVSNISTCSLWFTGMTLPTGVSDFLLECLDSNIEANTESEDGTNSYPSPETFRDDSDLGIYYLCFINGSRASCRFLWALGKKL